MQGMGFGVILRDKQRYDPAVGDPENGIAPGTAFEDLPDDFTCPLCGVGKEDFSPVED